MDIAELGFIRNLKLLELNSPNLLVAQSGDVMAVVAAFAIRQRDSFTFDGTVEGTDHTTNLFLASSTNPNALTELQGVEEVGELWVQGSSTPMLYFHSLYVNGYFGETHALFQG